MQLPLTCYQLGHDSAPVWDPEGPAHPHAFDCLAPLHAPHSYRPHGLEENLATIESKLHLPTHDATTSTSASSPSSPRLPLPWAAASNATATSTVSTNKYFDNTTIRCGQCGVEFTGAYRRGNLARHVRQKHTAAKGGPYTCTADGCYRVFARQDARLKHARKHHPGLCPEPTLRKQGRERESTTSQSVKDGAAATGHPRSNPRPIQSIQTHERLYGSPPRSGTSTPMPLTLDTDAAQWLPPVSMHVTGTKPTFSTKGTPMGSTGVSNIAFDIGQWLPTSPRTSVCESSIVHEARQKLQREVNSSIEVGELPRAARLVFASLHANLNPPHARHIDTAYATPVRNPRSPSASNEYYVAASMSTQPSSQGFDDASSQYRMSMQTDPSSVYDPVNQMLLSPFATPSDYHRTSVSSQAARNAPGGYRVSSATGSLRDEFAQAGNEADVTLFQTIDPSLLITPHSDNSQEDNDIRRQNLPDRS